MTVEITECKNCNNKVIIDSSTYCLPMKAGIKFSLIDHSEFKNGKWYDFIICPYFYGQKKERK